MLSWKSFFSYSEMASSKIFPIVPNMQNGQNEVGSPTGLPGFCSNTSWATFHQVGNTWLFKAELNTLLSIPRLARCMMVHTLLGIPPDLVTDLINCRIDFCCHQQWWHFLNFPECDHHRWELREQLICHSSDSFWHHSFSYVGTPTFFITIMYSCPKGSSSS